MTNTNAEYIVAILLCTVYNCVPGSVHWADVTPPSVSTVTNLVTLARDQFGWGTPSRSQTDRLLALQQSSCSPECHILLHLWQPLSHTRFMAIYGAPRGHSLQTQDSVKVLATGS